MKAKKRYVIGFWIAVSLVVGLGIAMVAVLSAFQARTSGGSFSISYTAYHVNAEMTASYKQPGASSYTQLKVKESTATTMTFDGSETEGFTKTFEDAPTLKFTRLKTTAVLRYTIKNTATAGSINVTKNFTGPTISGDISVKYAMLNNQSSIPSTDPTIDKTTANAALPDNTSIAAGKTLCFYVQITLTDNTDPASFAGAFNFILDAVDAN